MRKKLQNCIYYSYKKRSCLLVIVTNRLLMRRMCLLLLHNKLNLDAIFDTAGRKISSTFFGDGRHWD